MKSSLAHYILEFPRLHIKTGTNKEVFAWWKRKGKKWKSGWEHHFPIAKFTRVMGEYHFLTLKRLFEGLSFLYPSIERHCLKNPKNSLSIKQTSPNRCDKWEMRSKDIC